MLDLYVGAYWGPRHESIAQCAQRLGRFLQDLSKHDKLFSRWFCKIKRKSEEPKEWDFRREQVVEKAVQEGPHRDSDGKPIPELGFVVGWWNGQDGTRMAGLSVTCGLYTSNPGLSNVVLLDLPEALPGLTKPETMVAILSMVVKHWEPDWGGVISTTSRDARNLEPGEPFVDWIFYASNKLFPLKSLPQRLALHPVRGLGTIVVVQRKPVDANKLQDLARIESVEKALGVDQLRLLRQKEWQLFTERASKWQQPSEPITEVTPPSPPV